MKDNKEKEKKSKSKDAPKGPPFITPGKPVAEKSPGKIPNMSPGSKKKTKNY